MELSKLILKLNSGESLLPDELGEVVDFLNFAQTKTQTVSFDDIYERILVLGKAKAKEHRHLVESYLESKDPTTVALVLEVLCKDWQESNEYLERLMHFALGVPWDLEHDVQHTAISLIGEHIFSAFAKGKRDHPSSKNDETNQRFLEILRLLISLFEDDNLDLDTRCSAYFALCRAAGRKQDEIPERWVILRDEFEGRDGIIDYDMLAFLHKLIT